MSLDGMIRLFAAHYLPFESFWREGRVWPEAAIPARTANRYHQRMKFWQLDSLMRERPYPITDVARTRREWQAFGEWHANLDELCRVQDRDKLDAVLPDEFVRAVLSKVDMYFYLDAEGWLRGSRFHSSDERLTALEAFNRCGGEMLEDVIEKGVSHQKFFQGRSE